MPANLTFYITEGVLTGTANGHLINLDAVSGGGGGSKTHPGNSDTNNAASQSLKESNGAHHVHGGPIPAGRYRVLPPSHHRKLGLSARLDPYDDEQARHMYGRDGFYIHGRGPHGSDGCIVPMEGFAVLMAALTRDRGGVLLVAAGMGGVEAVR
ncbi:MAG: hypothetical protein ABJE95_27960 [Byssovorax sp.]